METKYGLDRVLRISATPTRLPVEPPPVEAAAEEPVPEEAADDPAADDPAADEPAAEDPAADEPAAEVAAPAALVVPAPADGVLLLDEQAASPTAAVTARPTAPIRWAPLCPEFPFRPAVVSRIGSLLGPYRTNRPG
jgi:hypothetical protein